VNLLKKKNRRTDLLIAVSNFGMFEEDLDTCKIISKEQVNQITSYNSLFGLTLTGISRTLSRVYIKKLFRKFKQNTKKEPLEDLTFEDNNSRRWGGGLESI